MTFLSINLAFAMLRQGLTIALVDADPRLGAVAVQLDLAEDRSLVYLAHEAALRRVDEQLVSAHLQTASGLDVLTGRAVAGLGDIVPAGVVGEVMNHLRRRYDVVVVDLGALDGPTAQETALLAQMLIWVAVPTKVGIDLLDRTLAGPLAGAVRTRPSFVVLNRLDTLALRDVDRSLRSRYGMGVIAAIPRHTRACQRAESDAVPAVFSGPLAKPLWRCARSVAAALRSAIRDVDGDSQTAFPYAGAGLVRGHSR
ncbi:MAG TPA: hypothetical protein VNH20_00900 [Candidatus Dormibacteraeota bacterium]|nr:hypothetical protein [Candidatus Dormibacteraeota bacterium]